MNHLKWMGHSSTVFDIQKSLRDDMQSCDVTLVAKGYSVRAHRFVLSSCSDLLRNLLQDMVNEATIVIPDVKGSLLDSVLSFIYLGETSLTSSNLSDFLEAINVLGIKSAISFECTTSLANNTTTLPVKSIRAIQLAQEELLTQDNMVPQKMDTENVISESQTSGRDLEFLDVYSEPQQKITYSIESMSGTTTGNEFILTENSGTFTLTQNEKLENASSNESDKIEEIEEDADDDGHIIEEYSSNADPIIEMPDSVPNVNTPSASSINATSAVLQISPPKMKKVKLRSQSNAIQQQLEQSMNAPPNTSSESISVLNTFTDTYSSSPFSDAQNNDAALELAVQSVIIEGISLQKAALKYEVSKTVLWRRVKKHPDYMKTTRENPVLSLAYERLKGGDSLKNISRELDIPMSTLHRHKVRLAQQGRLPKYVTFKKRDPNSKDELKEKLAKAVHACVHEGMSQNHAANLYDIPKSTLWRHLQKRVAEAERTQNMESEEIKEEIVLS